MKKKPLFNVKDKFYHPEQEVFVIVDDIVMPSKIRKEWLYTLKVFNPSSNVEGDPWKRYYESKVISNLIPLKVQAGAKVLFGNKE